MKTSFLGALAVLSMLAIAAPVVAAPAAPAVVTISAPAAGPDGDYYTFDLYNATPWTILTFQTGQPNGTYSRDWIPTRVLEAGDHVAMRFHNSEDACEYFVKVTFEDGDVWQQKLDFCNLESVIVNEDGTIEGSD